MWLYLGCHTYMHVSHSPVPLIWWVISIHYTCVIINDHISLSLALRNIVGPTLLASLLWIPLEEDTNTIDWNPLKF